MVFYKNRSVFALVAVLLVLLAGAVYFYNKTLNELAAGACSDVNGPECPHAKLVETQNIVIAALLLAILAIAGYLVYQSHWKKPEVVEQKAEGIGMAVAKPAYQERKKIDVSTLDSDEKKVVAIIQEQGGSTFQSEIIKQTNYSKVKISRVLDKLEQKGLIERKRRGMTNLVVIK